MLKVLLLMLLHLSGEVCQSSILVVHLQPAQARGRNDGREERVPRLKAELLTSQMRRQITWMDESKSRNLVFHAWQNYAANVSLMTVECCDLVDMCSQYLYLYLQSR